MAKKIVLPLLGELAKRESAPAPPKKPSIDAARARLGGRAKDAGPASLPPGTIVRVKDSDAIGVVVFASARDAHVLLGGSRLRRLGAEDVEAVGAGGEAAAGDALTAVAADARVFWLLAEGQSVRYADAAGDLRDGKLVEKCRYGALVLRDDGAIVAVGFRKLWPAAATGDA
ncbi:MAG TPA: hypothetical protein VIF62_12190 [Labilithrix sp.]